MFAASTNGGSRMTALATAMALVTAALAGGAMAVDEVNIDRTGLAIDGYDPVAYFTTGTPTKGDFQITAEHDGAVYRFATKQNRERFENAPHKYAPQFGGYCAYGVSVNAKFSADPTVWQIADGKLYLNLDRNIATKFNADLSGNIDKANRNWRTLADDEAR